MLAVTTDSLAKAIVLCTIFEMCIRDRNKIYPADLYFDLDLSAWHLEETEEFEGSTHHITKKRYTKEKHHYETAK